MTVVVIFGKFPSVPSPTRELTTFSASFSVVIGAWVLLKSSLTFHYNPLSRSVLYSRAVWEIGLGLGVPWDS